MFVAYTSPVSVLSVSLRNTGAEPLIIDDLKFAPLDADVTCFVHNELGKPAWVFGTNHFYVRSEYDAFGRLLRISEETSDGIVKRLDKTYNLGGY